jgi:raffinose/stachyose/melibiose transport system permease protein
MKTEAAYSNGVRKLGLSTSVTSIIARIIYYLFFISITMIVLSPVAVALFAALKPAKELASSSPLALPQSFYLENFTRAIQSAKFPLALWNTGFLVMVSVAANTILGSATAYVLHRFDFKMKKVVYALFMLAMVVPFYTTEVARFQIIKWLGVYNTLYAPMIIYAGTDLMQIFIYIQFMSKISEQLDESAMMDGASYVTIFRKIIFPLLLPASATLAIIKAVDIMNDMYTPYLYMPSKKLITLSTSLMSFFAERGADWSLLSAGIIIVLLPTLLIYVFFQRYIFAGITDGAVKG